MKAGEIKFRAWFDGAMRGPETLDLIANHGFIWWEGSTLHEINPGHPDAIVMQYTGLHDKGGKEIYEGDIVEAEELKSDYPDDRELHVEKYRNVVEYCHSEFVWADEDSRVIGNIYENPELLAGKP